MRIKNFQQYNLLLEKSLAQLISKIEVTFNLELIKTKHSDTRETRDDVENKSEWDESYNTKIISNDELVEFGNYFKREIAEHIASGEIVDNVTFVIKSDSRELACVLLPHQEASSYWKLKIITIWRESPSHRLKVGKNQLVIKKP